MPWQINTRESSEWTVTLLDSDGAYRAFIKRDGCIEFYRAFNGADPSTASADVQQIHICDIDDMLERLNRLKEIALDYFGPDWGD